MWQFRWRILYFGTHFWYLGLYIESGWVGRMALGQTAKFKVGFAHKITTSPHCGEKLIEIFFFSERSMLGEHCSQMLHVSNFSLLGMSANVSG